MIKYLLWVYNIDFSLMQGFVFIKQAFHFYINKFLITLSNVYKTPLLPLTCFLWQSETKCLPIIITVVIFSFSFFHPSLRQMYSGIIGHLFNKVKGKNEIRSMMQASEGTLGICPCAKLISLLMFLLLEGTLLRSSQCHYNVYLHQKTLREEHISEKHEKLL